MDGKSLIAKLKKKSPGTSGAVYDALSKLGYVKGNKEADKGVATKEHTEDVKKKLLDKKSKEE